MTDESRSPRTEAGKRLLKLINVGGRMTEGRNVTFAGRDVGSLILAIEAEAAAPRSGEGLDPDYEFMFGQPLCARCYHPHTDGSWSDKDPDDGTCWSAGSLVCGCPKFITPAVQRMALSRAARLRENTNAE